MTLTDVLAHPYLLLTARCLVGGVLVGAGIAKAHDRTAFVRVVLDYRIVPQRVAGLLGQTLPYAEVGVGTCLFVGLALRYTALAGTLMFAAFGIAIGTNLVRGRHLECYCFGRAGSSKIGLSSILRSLVLTALAGDIFLNGSGYLSVDAILAGSSSTTRGTPSITGLLIIWLMVAAAYLCYALLKAVGLVTLGRQAGESNG